ncbi:MAG: suppressor of glycerol defect [Chrysothrix sp. TS-e1954]|nr:MAG: suppressor of glycerol defect [Chrysothrix sp. TS-e1954]
MPSSSYSGPRIPHTLLQQVQPNGTHKQKRSAKYRTGLEARKDRRKIERTQKKLQQPRRSTKVPSFSSASSDNQESHPPALEKPVKPILKSAKVSSKVDETPTKPIEKVKRGKEPQLKVRKVTREDEEIAALEKKLGIRKKNSKVQEDGLDDIFGNLGDGGSSDDEYSRKRKLEEGEDWLHSKRRRTSQRPDEDAASLDDSEGLLDRSDNVGTDDSDSTTVEDDDDGGGQEALSGEDGDEDIEDDDGESDPGKRQRENPYLPGGGQGPSTEAKYVPPSRRQAPINNDEAALRLRRQTQGHLNKLSEANTVSILSEITKLYQNNPRQHVTTTLIDLLLILICDRTALSDTFLILHAGFISAIHKTVGLDFSAQLVEESVKRFDDFYSATKTDSENEKQCNNLISLLTQLYTFQVVNSTLIFDITRQLLGSLSETNTELLLRLVKSAGTSLRKDDPTALKDIVSLLKRRVAESGGEANLSVRGRFMIETISDLKDNRLKTGRGTSAVFTEHVTRMKKILGSLNTRDLQASEPLSVSLEDIRHADKRGKWWLVGASWKGASSKDLPKGDTATASKENADERLVTDPADADPSTDLLHLAKSQRMNTSVRRSIFLCIMSASDYADAHHRLTKLNLTRSQELEFPRVLLHCAGAEGRYNPYYTLIARKLCKDKKLRMGFQFACWDLFRRMGERDQGGDEDETGEDAGGLSVPQAANYARLYGTLVADGSLSIAVLKTLDLTALKPQTSMFVEGLLATVFTAKRRKSGTESGLEPDQILETTFEPAKELPQLNTGLRWFLKTVMAESDIAQGQDDRKRVVDSCKRMRRYLARH